MIQKALRFGERFPRGRQVADMTLDVAQSAERFREIEEIAVIVRMGRE